MVLNKAFKVSRRWRPCRSVLLESKNIHEEGLLFESGSLAILTPAEIELIKKDYPSVDSAYGCLGVVQGEGFLYLVLITGCVQVGKVGNTEVYRITHTLLVPLHATPYQHEGAIEMGKLLACGQFYFSIGEGGRFSLMNRAQRQDQEQSHFHWNRNLYVYLQRFGIDCSKWLFSIICGSVQIQTVYAGDKQVKSCLISRLSCERAGTRFNVRGLNDEGHVANFVETEQSLYIDRNVASFVQVRGLVPVFWDQPGIQTGTNRIRLSRGFHSSHPAFERHFERLLKEYGPTLCVNLLGNRDMEPLLTEAFIEHLNELTIPGATDFVYFDYHLHCRPGHKEALESILLPECQQFLDSSDFYLELNGEVEKAQTGTMRHNCLDCLDRSNNAQTLFGLQVLPRLIESLGVSLKSTVITRFRELYRNFWAQNGDNISRFYAGTRALNGKSKVGKFRDGARSVQRTIQNNFLDNNKQEAIDILLLSGYVGELGWKTRALLSTSDALASLPLRKALCDRWQDFTVKEKLRVCIGTWNVNGGKHVRSIALKNHSMHDWLLDAPLISGKTAISPEDYQNPVDIYAIGFQELVGLTASNLVSTSSSNRHEWAAELQRVLSRDHTYSLLTAVQLVGVCLYIFVRPHLVPFIRDVAVSSVKTGIGGKAGNKGGVAIRFLLDSSSFCFVCSHFAAHQMKVLERNHDFAEICRKVQFPLGQTIETHDYVFWCGDFNYRIELPLNLAKDSITQQNWDKLIRHDQLIKQNKLGKVFQGFCEGYLNFAPTYKYDEFSDDYDTSEKGRIPAWCDRVLWKKKSFLPPTQQHGIAKLTDDSRNNDVGTGEFGWHPSNIHRVYEKELASGKPDLEWWHPGRLLHYGRAELKTSDHRPVIALLEVDIFRVDEKARERVRKEVVEAMGPADATVIVSPVNVEQNPINTSNLVDVLQQYGAIVLVRATETATLVTFNKSQSAIAAVDYSGKEVDGIIVTVKLKHAEDEMSGDSLSILTGAQLPNAVTNGGHDGREMEALSFAEEDEDEEMEEDEEEINVNDDESEEEDSPLSDDHLLHPLSKPKRPPPPSYNPPTPIMSDHNGGMTPPISDSEHIEDTPHLQPTDTTSDPDQPRPKPMRPSRPPPMRSQHPSDERTVQTPSPDSHSLRPIVPVRPNSLRVTAMELKLKKPDRPPLPVTKPRSHTVDSANPTRQPPSRPPPPYVSLYPH